MKIFTEMELKNIWTLLIVTLTIQLILLITMIANMMR